MSHVSTINIHDTDRITARAECNSGTCWLSLIFSDDSKREFRVSVFMDFDRASRLAAFINEAGDPAFDADPVITWPRPSYHRQAKGRCPDCGGSTLLGCHCFEASDRPVPDGPGMRGEDTMPMARLDALQGDGPDEAA